MTQQIVRRPMLACDWNEAKVQKHFERGGSFMLQPKIDGVRAMHVTGQFTGRPLEPFANVYTQSYFNAARFTGLDGELAAERETHPALCRLTSSAVNGNKVERPFTLWWLFDYVQQGQLGAPYEERYTSLRARVIMLNEAGEHRVRVMPSVVVNTMAQLLEHEERWLGMGFEGVIGRDPQGVYKEGRATAREGLLWRIKRFEEEEFIVDELVEAEENTNPQEANALGLMERSSHKAGKVPKGMVGAFKGRKVKDDAPITVGPGELSHEDRVLYWKHPERILHKKCKYKHFPKGVKDKPRFPTFVCIVGKGDQ